MLLQILTHTPVVIRLLLAGLAALGSGPSISRCVGQGARLLRMTRRPSSAGATATMSRHV